MRSASFSTDSHISNIFDDKFSKLTFFLFETLSFSLIFEILTVGS